MVFRKFATAFSLLLALPVAAVMKQENGRRLQITYPEKRYSADWSTLEADILEDALTLNYDQEKWDLEYRPFREQLRYSALLERLDENETIALTNLVPNEESWDCWINHYDGYSWAEIQADRTLSQQFAALGWVQTSWESSNYLVSDTATEKPHPYGQFDKQIVSLLSVASLHADRSKRTGQRRASKHGQN